ncbi:hypothetical protein SmB9_30600 [Sphingosinicella microcystinivorans]|uniref:Uncharacterized protein n=1 Tax=Sphingosinicella microcystinivorans TaxID=335406 RepID=A0AAD1D8L4_SPHMI|nr:hypothetical protein SmB9_30600 [Sphingosinicella microcystinivorans]
MRFTLICVAGALVLVHVAYGASRMLAPKPEPLPYIALFEAPVIQERWSHDFGPSTVVVPRSEAHLIMATLRCGATRGVYLVEPTHIPTHMLLPQDDGIGRVVDCLRGDPVIQIELRVGEWDDYVGTLMPLRLR